MDIPLVIGLTGKEAIAMSGIYAAILFLIFLLSGERNRSNTKFISLLLLLLVLEAARISYILFLNGFWN